MKLTKGQWRMLMTELLEIHNLLKDIQRRLPPEVGAISVSGQSEPQPGASLIDAGATANVPDVGYANLRWRTQNPDGTWRDCIE